MKKAFTLLELLLAISLSTLILLGGIYLFSTQTRAYKIAGEKINKLQAKQIILREISKDIRSARSIQVVGNKLTLTYPDKTISYEYLSNKVKKQEKTTVYYLTDDNEIKSLTFKIIKPGLVKILIENTTLEVFCRNG